tara:strand:+ start:367 stop:609 length:243 start_codon:yes stop_codon:yes gene_type:complete
MIKLHPETAQEIATLINRIDVAKLMREGVFSTDKCSYYIAAEFKAIIELTEEYGIPHVNYDHAVESMKFKQYANATLGSA